MIETLKQMIKDNDFDFVVEPDKLVFPATKDYKEQVFQFEKVCNTVQEFSDELDNYLNFHNSDCLAIELFQNRKTPVSLGDTLEEMHRRANEVDAFSDIMNHRSYSETYIESLYNVFMHSYFENDLTFQEFCENIKARHLESLNMKEIVELYGALSNSIDGDIVSRKNKDDDVCEIFGKEILKNHFIEEDDEECNLHYWGGEEKPAHIENIKPWVTSVNDTVSDLLEKAYMELAKRTLGREELTDGEKDNVFYASQAVRELFLKTARYYDIPVWNPTADNYEF